MATAMPGDWVESAACAGVDPYIFHPVSGGNLNKHSYAAAKSVCQNCPVREECLEFAMRVERNERLAYRCGVWGGLTPGERRDLEAQRIAAGAPPRARIAQPSYRL